MHCIYIKSPITISKNIPNTCITCPVDYAVTAKAILLRFHFSPILFMYFHTSLCVPAFHSDIRTVVILDVLLSVENGSREWPRVMFWLAMTVNSWLGLIWVLLLFFSWVGMLCLFHPMFHFLKRCCNFMFNWMFRLICSKILQII